MELEPDSLAKYFDGWYADMTGSPVMDEIQQRHLGLPPHLLSTSLLGWDGIAEAAAALRLPGGSTLVDLACGRGGYGLEIAARSGARLVGSTSLPRRCARPASRPGGSASQQTSGSATWPRRDWTPGRPAPCCASMRSSSPRSQTPPTARSSGS